MTDQPDQPAPDDLSRIVIATGNPHKVEELRRLLALPGIEFVGLKDLPGHDSLTEPEETGNTFEANATIKALSYAAQTGLTCLADDSGLEVDALGGAPGVISSHYCTDGREVGMSRAERDAANNARLLRELETLPAEHRSARFVCVMVLASAASVLATSRGTFEGRIGLPGPPPAGVPRGTNGFGYDPLFLAGPECRQTGAELSAQEKNRRSHRGVAARDMLQQLRARLHPA
ncbi:MAG: non-canonical purine NTP pyrophosphatase [Phycisphaerales bacterium JB041]